MLWVCFLAFLRAFWNVFNSHQTNQTNWLVDLEFLETWRTDRSQNNYNKYRTVWYSTISCTLPLFNLVHSTLGILAHRNWGHGHGTEKIPCISEMVHPNLTARWARIPREWYQWYTWRLLDLRMFGSFFDRLTGIFLKKYAKMTWRCVPLLIFFTTLRSSTMKQHFCGKSICFVVLPCLSNYSNNVQAYPKAVQ